MHQVQIIFIIASLVFIFMSIKAHANVLAHQAAQKKQQQQRQKAPLYYRTGSL